MEIGLSILLGWALAALALFLLVYSAIRLALKHGRRSRLRGTAHQTRMDRLTEQRSAKPWTEQDGL
jgi:hypothetical protein